MSYRLLVIVFLVGLTWPVWAEGQNPAVAAAQSNWEAARDRSSRALSLDDPKVGLAYEKDGTKFFVEQAVRFPGKIYAAYQADRHRADLSRVNYLAVAAAVRAETKTAYYDLYLTDRSLEVAREAADILKRLAKIAQSRYVTGQVTQADLLQASNEHLLMENEAANLLEERKSRAARVHYLLGESGDSTVEVVPPTLPATLPAEADLARLALKERPELLAGEADRLVKKDQQLAAVMDYFPDLALGAKKRSGDGWDATFALSIPLYFWKQGSDLAAAGAEQAAAAAAYKELENKTLYEVAAAYNAAIAAERTGKLYEQTVLPQNRQALQTAMAAYESGKTDFSELLQIEKSYWPSKLEYYQAQTSYGKALAALEQITGREIK